jgi:starvation-inducible DNA-binding protein
MRESIDWTDDLNDAATSDIFTEITRGLDAWLWKFEAHQGK